MLLPYFGCGKDRDEVRGRGGFLYIRSTMGILALDEAHHANHFESEFTGRFDGLHGRGSGGANIVHDHHLRAFLAEAFDTLASTVLLLGLTHEEAVYGSAGDSDGDDDGVGAHGQSADGGRFPALLADFSEKDFANELCSVGVESSRPAVDVIVAGAAGGQLKLTQAKGLVRHHFQELLSCSGHVVSGLR